MSSKPCLCCSKLTDNPKFCSRSCGAKITNKVAKKKRTKFSYCQTCGKECRYRRKFCKDCFKDSTCPDYTLGDAIYEQHHKASAFALVRSRARSADKAKLVTECEHCGYDKHVEVCHIKPIADFPLDTKLSVINSEPNILSLCPKCHWESDHQLVKE